MNNYVHSLLALAISAAACSSFALQPMNDNMMQDITGQGGITIEETTTDPTGKILSTGEIRYTQKDNNGSGAAYLSIGSLDVRAYKSDVNGNFAGLSTIKRVIDLDANGNLSIKTTDIDTMDIKLGALSIGKNRFVGGIDIDVWKFADGSYLEAEFKNDPTGAKMISRAVMKTGTGFSQRVYENDMIVASDVVFLPAAGQDAFVSEMIVSNDNNKLKLEFGNTKGTMELKGFRILNADGSNPFGAGNSFFDVGFGNITVNKGYMTIAGSQSPDRNGIEGVFYSDINVGNLYLRTGDNQINAKNVSLKTSADIGYTLGLIDNGFTSGLEGELFSSHGTADLTIGGITLTNANGESPSVASIAIKNFSLNGGTAEFGIYSSQFFGYEGMRQIVNIENASFDLTIAGKDEPLAPKLVGEIVVNNFTLDQHMGNTKQGIYTIVESNSFDMNINIIRIGDGSTYKGTTGRLVVNNFQQMPGSYMRIEPLQ